MLRQEDTESERESITRAMSITMVTRRRSGTAVDSAKPYKAGIGQAASGTVGISLDLSSIRGRDSPPEFTDSD